MIQLCSETSNGIPSHSESKPKYRYSPTDPMPSGPCSPSSSIITPLPCFAATLWNQGYFFNIPGMHPPSGFTPLSTSHLPSLSTFQRGHPWLHFSFTQYKFTGHSLHATHYCRVLGYNSALYGHKFLPSWSKGRQVISNPCNIDINLTLTLTG